MTTSPPPTGPETLAGTVEPGPVDGARDVPPSGRVQLAVRLVLLLALLVALVQAVLQPAQRSVDDLLAALDAGEVATVTIERPTPPISTSLGVRWSGDGRPGTARYEVHLPESDVVGDDSSGIDLAQGSGSAVDEGATILAAAQASPREVDVREVEQLPDTAWPLGPHAVTVAVLLVATWVIGVIVLLIGGPQPRLATRWAWFWLLAYAWPVALAFLLLEPTPAWSRRALVAPARRLTGGWAFLLAVLLGPLLVRAVTGG